MWVEGILATSRLGPKSPMKFFTFTLFALQTSKCWRPSCVLRVGRQWYNQKERGFWVAGKGALPYKNQGEDSPTMGKLLGVCLGVPSLVCRWMHLSPITPHSRNVRAQETFMVNQASKIIIRQATYQGRKGQPWEQVQGDKGGKELRENRTPQMKWGSGEWLLAELQGCGL